MTITCISQASVTQTPDGEAVTQEGDNPQQVYQQCRFSNGYQCDIPNWWGIDEINAEIERIIGAFSSEAPPTNWIPYDGYESIEI